MLRFKNYLIESSILPGFVPTVDPYYESNPATNPNIYGPPSVPGLPGGQFQEGQIYYNPATGYTYQFVDGGWQIISGPNKPQMPTTNPPPPPNQDPQEIAPTRVPGRKGQNPGTGSGSGTGGGSGTGQGGVLDLPPGRGSGNKPGRVRVTPHPGGGGVGRPRR